MNRQPASVRRLRHAMNAQPIIAGANKVIAAIVLVALAAWWASPAVAAPVTWADPAKTLHIAFPVAETGFDPAPIQDYYSANVLRMIFDSLYVPDYLARPYRVAPNTADGMPQVSADGKVWTIPIRKGIYFADDPVFKGKKRELTAQDYVYAWKRVVDPKVRAPASWSAWTTRSRRRAAPASSTTTPRFPACAQPVGTRCS